MISSLPKAISELKPVVPMIIRPTSCSSGATDPIHSNTLLINRVLLFNFQMVLICISNEFVACAESCKILHYAKSILQKNIFLVVLGKDMKWQKTNIGMLFSTEVT